MLFIWCDCDQTINTSCQRISGTEKPGQNKPSLGSNYVLTMRKNRLIDCSSAYDSVSGDWRLMKVTARQLMFLLYFIQFIHLYSCFVPFKRYISSWIVYDSGYMNIVQLFAYKTWIQCSWYPTYTTLWLVLFTTQLSFHLMQKLLKKL